MGLDVSHDCWHGSYHLFEAFRQRLMQAAIVYYERVLAGGEPEPEGPDEKQKYWARLKQRLAEESEALEQEFAKDALAVLLWHSDCDGSIAWADEERLAARLEELAPILAKGEASGMPPLQVPEFAAGNARIRALFEQTWASLTPEWFAQRALQFARGLRQAYALHQDVVFA